jgi:hypothetical protein
MSDPKKNCFNVLAVVSVFQTAVGVALTVVCTFEA